MSSDIKAEIGRLPILCRLGFHTGPKYVDAYSQAPAPLRCTRCGGLRYPPAGGEA